MGPLRPPIPAREARPAPFARLYIRTLAQTATFWVVFLVVLPLLIVLVEDRLGLADSRPVTTVQRAVAIAIFIPASALGLWSGWIMTRHGRGTPLPFDCPRALVVRGPYRHVRNPMAIAGLAQGAAVAVWLGSVSVLVYVLAGLILWNFLIRRWEEHDMEARFGIAFIEYRDAVRCWLPRINPYVAAQPPSANTIDPCSTS